MNVRANKVVLLVTSLGTLTLLLVAAYRENVAREWRQIQRTYRAQLPAPQAAEFGIQLRQVYVPALKATDRCISCHVGMAPGESGLNTHTVYATHPDVVHDPLQYGCVVCHGGQGRATERTDAHGTVPHWPHPMLERGHIVAGCGTCHTHLAVPNLALLTRGHEAFARAACATCHALDGTTPATTAKDTRGPDLSRAGSLGYAPDWYERHVARRAAAAAGPWRTSIPDLSAADRAAIGTLLDSRVGTPGLIEAKATFHSLGCRGCHKVGGIGGDDGPDLTREGDKDPARFDYTHVPGDHTFPNWLAAHFRDPAKIVPGSQMPVLGLTDAQIDALVLYMLSLRRSDQPEAYWPRDRIRAERFGAREFATDGATLYGTFCAACHGARGEGTQYPGLPRMPAIGNPDFLAVAPDRFIADTVRHGRPGRRMPAWGDKDGGLRPAEIEAVVGYVRTFGDGAPSPTDSGPRRWVTADPKAGAAVYATRCAPCHGANGEGTIGPALNNRGLLAQASDRYLIETIKRGRRGTPMVAFGGTDTMPRQLSDAEIDAVVAFVRTWEPK